MCYLCLRAGPEKYWSRRWELNPRPVDYEMSSFAVSRWFSVSGLLPLSLPFAPILRVNLQRNLQHKCDIGICVKEKLSTRDAAKKLGVALLTLQRHVTAKTVDAPPLQKVGGVSVRLWSAREIEKARKVLSGIRPGRKKKEA